jgi:hypothetical protein
VVIKEIFSELWTLFLGLDHSELAINFLFVLLWIVSFGATLCGLMFSVFLSVSHGDLRDGAIEPMELSNSLQQVSYEKKECFTNIDDRFS